MIIFEEVVLNVARYDMSVHNKISRVEILNKETRGSEGN